MAEKTETNFTLITGAGEPQALRLVAAALGDKESRFSFGRGEGFDPRDEANAERVDRLRKAVEAGDVRELEFEATVTRTGRGKTHFQWDPKDFERFAESFKGKPFLKDHREESDARGGTIRDSWVEASDEYGKVMKQRISVVKKWAMENLLDGTMDRFSIGASRPEQITCSICAKDPRDATGLFGGACHVPGRLYDLKGKAASRRSGNAKEANFTISGQEGMETSAVVSPAFTGTGLSAMKLTASGAVAVPYEQIFGKTAGVEQEDEAMNETMQKLKALFGLAADAEDSAVVEAAEKAIQKEAVLGRVTAAARLKDGDSESDLLAIVMERTVGGAVAVAKLQDELATERAEHAVERAIAAGKFTAADRESCLADAKLNLEAFEKVVARRPPVGPVAGEGPPGGGSGREITGAAAQANEQDEEEFGFKFTAKDKPLTEDERHFLRSTSKGAVNPEVFLKVRREHQRLEQAGAKEFAMTQRI
jgi:Mu-like prophage I protein